MSRTLDVLGSRIESLLEAERESVADLAHRLRTPVTAIHLEVEAMPDGPGVEQLLDRVHRLERVLSDVIEQMRHRSRSAAPARADLRAAAAERLTDWAEVAADIDHVLEVDIGTEPRWVGAEMTDLEAAIDVLVDNALTHTPPGTAVRVTVADADGGAVRLRVEDDGPGLPQSGLSARGASAQAPSGLGLDIARRTAERAGGPFSIGPSAGGGARVEPAIPILPEEV